MPIHGAKLTPWSWTHFQKSLILYQGGVVSYALHPLCQHLLIFWFWVPLKKVNWELFRKVKGLEIMSLGMAENAEKVSTDEHLCLLGFKGLHALFFYLQDAELKRGRWLEKIQFLCEHGFKTG